MMARNNENEILNIIRKWSKLLEANMSYLPVRKHEQYEQNSYISIFYIRNKLA